MSHPSDAASNFARIKRILGEESGGLLKRLDQNRELLQALQNEAPLLLEQQPALVAWIKSQDEFLQALLPWAEPSPAQQSYRAQGYAFPRDWPELRQPLRKEEMPSVPTGAIKRLGSTGIRYLVGLPLCPLSNGDWMVEAVVLKTYTRVHYRLSAIHDDVTE